MKYTLPNQTVKKIPDERKDVEVQYVITTTTDDILGIAVTARTERTCIRIIEAQIQGCQDVIASKQQEIIKLQSQLTEVEKVVDTYELKG